MKKDHNQEYLKILANQLKGPFYVSHIIYSKPKFTNPEKLEANCFSDALKEIERKFRPSPKYNHFAGILDNDGDFVQIAFKTCVSGWFYCD